MHRENTDSKAVETSREAFMSAREFYLSKYPSVPPDEMVTRGFAFSFAEAYAQARLSPEAIPEYVEQLRFERDLLQQQVERLEAKLTPEAIPDGEFVYTTERCECGCLIKDHYIGIDGLDVRNCRNTLRCGCTRPSDKSCEVRLLNSGVTPSAIERAARRIAEFHAAKYAGGNWEKEISEFLREELGVNL